MSHTEWTRRQFIQASAALSLPVIIPAHVLATTDVAWRQRSHARRIDRHRFSGRAIC